MLKLFKYEMRKTLMSKLILLGITACMQGYFMYGYFTKDSNSCTIASILLTVLAVMGVIFIGIQSVVTLHHDMNTKQSYMLFMTPHSNYAILGAKALECTLSVVMAGLFFFGLGYLDVTLLFSRFGEIKQLMEFFQSITQMVSETIKLNLATVVSLVIESGIGWIETVMVAFLADVLISAVMKGQKFGGLLAFVLFIVLSGISQKVAALVPDLGSTVATVAAHCAVVLAFAVGEFIASATVMEKKLSV